MVAGSGLRMSDKLQFRNLDACCASSHKDVQPIGENAPLSAQSTKNDALHSPLALYVRGLGEDFPLSIQQSKAYYQGDLMQPCSQANLGNLQYLRS